GMDSFTLQPAAGSQGELTGIMIMRRYHTENGNPRKKVLIPDSAHGTNPASVVISGYESIPVKSNNRGLVDVDDLSSKLDEEVAGMMITNPNTLGLFEEEISTISKKIHDVGALLYLDGANFNALISLMKPANMGFDITHLNLHKTFSTPHGGGGPGAGPVGVISKLSKYLPYPRVQKVNESYTLSQESPDSIGRLHGFFGNFGILVRAYTYIRLLGYDGFGAASKNAIINANYLKKLVTERYDIPFDQNCMHEFVVSAEAQKKRGAKAGDIVKRLLDFGVHAPTVYFPLIVKEALMIEPTESESKSSLEDFSSILEKIDDEIDENPSLLTDAPFNTPIRRLDEAKAVRELRLTWDKVGN
ncbi:MAG: aminomethyl-transferring glycine dehydrogenase subunit GcvPB, partial [Candidatus Marinimicrobia bacterium]|nr:aminomethyl-transferring glycine dehydrogenase subunit GcvPB [Candidatus Neomarinimicrobiota bacterium]